MDKDFREEIEQETKTINISTMDIYDKRRMRNIKERLISILESGQVTDPSQQYELVDATCNELLVFKDKKTCDMIIHYMDDQDKLKTSIEEKQKEIQKLMDEYGDNVKQIYEMIKKL